MENFNFFDISMFIFILALGIKGFMNGIIKEFFAFFGMIGGVYIASRTADDFGESLNLYLNLTNISVVYLIGFIAVVLLFWMFSFGIGLLASKIADLSGLGIVDKLLGFAVGSAKIFLIFSVIFYLFSTMQLTKDLLSNSIKHSFLYPVFVASGELIFAQQMPQELNLVSDETTKQKEE